VKLNIRCYCFQDVAKYQQNSALADSIALPAYMNPEYNLIVQANNLSVDVDNEILLVHKAIAFQLHKIPYRY
jgi:U4/U6 small nuclear ribonucleoprotein PRP31